MLSAEAAHIGDPDVDFDISAVLCPVLRYDTDETFELLVEFRSVVGGVYSDEEVLTDSDIESISMTVVFLAEDSCPRPDAEAMIDRLCRWGGAESVVRIVSAPGKATTVYGPDDEVAFLPRMELELQ